ncbi:MAG: glycosyltransferase family 4 protein [Cellvibrionaceae bacterium]
MNKGKTLLFVINADWYFKLHWLARAEAARAEGYNVHICTGVSDEKIPDFLEGRGFAVHPIEINRKTLSPLINISALLAIRKVIKAVQPTLVHSITVKPNLFAGLVCGLSKTPLVMSVTGLGRSFSGSHFSDRLARFVITKTYRFICKHRNVRVIFENGDDLSVFKNQSISTPDKLVLIPGAGVDLEEYAYQPEGAQSTLKILFAARMLWDKGLPDVISAVKKLREKGVDVELKVAGILDYDNSAAIPEGKILEWHKCGDIFWLGQQDDMVSLIADSSVVVLPTTYGEGVPRVLIEAAAVGRPLIATDVAGCRDIVEDGKNGFLVRCNQPDAIAVSLEKLLNPELRREQGKAGRVLVEGKFAQPKVIEKTLNVYGQVLSH